MIKINIPHNNLEERKYIINILFGEFLYLDYLIEIRDIQNYEIILQDGNKLIIEDHFFSKYSKDKEYLKVINIPQNVEFVKNDFIVENDIPVIYGNDKFEVLNGKIICGIDILASSFFMLTRWEEYVNRNRDKYNRFPAGESLAFKNNFLNRPIVNEYTEMLWNILAYLGVKQKRQTRQYQSYFTHDVDVCNRWRNVYVLLRAFVGDIVNRKDLFRALSEIISYFKTKFKMQKDPYDTFEYIMSLSEKYGTKSYFFFMSGGTSKYDNFYSINSKFTRELMIMIDRRGHNIGFHPSYNTYNNFKQWQKEYRILSSISPQKIFTGRQHFLRLKIPTTFQICEDAGIERDSSLAYPEVEGFRCGCCYEFSIYNFLTQEKLKLKELPLIFMDSSSSKYKGKNYDSIIQKIDYLNKKIKKYNGNFVVLLHNSYKSQNIVIEPPKIYEILFVD